MIKYKKAISLVELLISIFILVVGFSALLILYSTSAVATQRAKNRMFATKEASTVYEAVNHMPLSMIRAHKDDKDYWQTLGEGLLPNEFIGVESINDATWSKDPLNLEITISWLEFGATSDIKIDAQFTEQK